LRTFLSMVAQQRIYIYIYIYIHTQRERERERERERDDLLFIQAGLTCMFYIEQY